MTLVRPLVTDFKMTVRADCTVACSPLPLSIKALARWLLVWGSSILGRHPLYLPPRTIAGIQNKAKFPCHQPELSWLLSSELPDLDLVTVWYIITQPTFINVLLFFGPSSLAYTTVHLNCHSSLMPIQVNIIPISPQYILSQDIAHCKAERLSLDHLQYNKQAFPKLSQINFTHHHTCSNNSREPPFKAGDGVFKKLVFIHIVDN